jgi:hypothetical protein
MSQPSVPRNKRRNSSHLGDAHEEAREEPHDRARARKRRRVDTDAHAAAAHLSAALAVWRAKFGAARWVLFANGTAVRTPLALGADETANCAIATLTGLGRTPSIPVTDRRVPGTQRPSARDAPQSGGWMAGPFGDAPVYVFIKADGAQTAEAAAQVATRRVREDRDLLQIVHIEAP